MASIINLSFYDKNYTIEYDRASVRYVIEHTEDDGMKQVVVLIKGGLLKHHKNEMPSDDDVLDWVIALGENSKEFANALQEMVGEVLKTFEEDRKNLKWVKAKA